MGTHSCGGATGNASKLRNMGFIQSDPGRLLLLLSLAESMAVIDDNMHTAWRSVQIGDL